MLALVGPTASGKSAVAVDLAIEFDGEIVSADSMQIYRGMDVGTAKPTVSEMGRVPHHLIDIITPDQDFDVARYQESAREAIAGIHSRGRLPILVGGTGLYVRAIIDGLSLAPADATGAVRAELQRVADREGERALRRRLAEVDPEAELAILPGNLRRLIRAIEVYELSGRTFTSFNEEDEERRSHPIYDVEMVGLRRDRDELYRRIDERVERMFEAGLLDEARELAAMNAGTDTPVPSGAATPGAHPGPAFVGTALHAIGYREALAFLRGDLTLHEAMEETQKASRRYAKRQLTWFRRDERVHWVDISGLAPEDAIEAVRGHLSSCSIWERVKRTLGGKAQ